MEVGGGKQYLEVGGLVIDGFSLGHIEPWEFSVFHGFPSLREGLVSHLIVL